MKRTVALESTDLKELSANYTIDGESLRLSLLAALKFTFQLKKFGLLMPNYLTPPSLL